MMVGILRVMKLGFRSLFLHKLRSGLTAIGILCGVASVIAMLSIGEGLSQKAQEDIRDLGSTNIIVRSRKPPEAQTTQQVSMWTAQEYGVTYLDADVIRQTLPSVRVVVPVRETPKDIWYANNKVLGKVYGTVPAFADVSGLEIREGRWLSDLDFNMKANVVVLSEGAGRRLFPTTDPVGEKLLIGQERFTVVGVLAPYRSKKPGAAPDSREGLYVPLSTARSWFGETTVKTSSGSMERERVQLHEMKIRVERSEDVIATANVVRAILARNHKKEDYEITVPLELLQQSEEKKQMFNLVLGIMAGISLLVGGIGIMNVMLATVTERTREIGIRRALGAKRYHIVSQFLVETIVLSGGGGVLGIPAGWFLPGLFTPLLARFTGNAEFRTIPRIEFALLAFVISALVGIMAGVYPAMRAATMDPVEALRHE